MLSLFPELFTYGILALAILRIIAGAFLVSEARLLWRTRRKADLPHAVILAETSLLALAGAMLILGIWSQAAAIAGLAWIAFSARAAAKDGARGSAWNLLMLAAILITILLNGAGPFAFDLPL